MIQLIRTNVDDPRFQMLAKLSEKELRVLEGDAIHDFLTEENALEKLKKVLLVLENNQPIGSGAIRFFDENTMEIKKVFVKKSYRKKGIAIQIMKELEAWSHELGYQFCVLETGKVLESAVNLYTKIGYKTMPNFPPFEHINTSVCMKKELK